MKIAIRFHDNDFGNTFIGVLQFLLNAYKHYGQLPEDKAELAIIINEISVGAYFSYQNQFEYTHGKTIQEEMVRLRKYLNITVDRIMVDGEVDEYLAKTEWNNRETFILDTDLDYDGNNSVYSI